MTPGRAPAIAAAWLTLLVAGSARADVADEPPPDADECTVDDKCPDTGVECGGASCFGEDQCPGSAVECDWNTDPETYAACQNAAEAAGLEQRCEGKLVVYCAPDEGPPAGSAAACVRDAEASGKKRRCTDGSNVVYCDPAEDEPSCAVETVGGGLTGHGALAVFLAAAAATGVRAARRRRG